jgi:hypothetical protein
MQEDTMNRLTLGATALFIILGATSMTGCATSTHASGRSGFSSQGGTGQSAASSEHGTSNNVPNAAVSKGSDASVPVPAGTVPKIPIITKTLKPAPVSTITIKPTGSSAPYFVSASLQCVVTDHESFPGEKDIPLYQPQLSWELKNATGMALSIDNPGLVGSYGTYDWHGTLILGAGCYTDEGTHTVVLYSVGDTGLQVAQFTIHETGTMTRPTPPPFAYPTAPIPTPSPSGH